MDLNGKVAIVTGASRGLGKAIALGLAENGARVAVAARTEVEVPSLPGTIHLTVDTIKKGGGEAVGIRCDVTDEAQVNAMVERVTGLFGRVDILINNSGVAFPVPLWELPVKRWRLTMKVNLTGPFLCTRAVLPGMMARKGGSIINISSVQADRPGNLVTGTAYSVSKAALECFTSSAAAETAPYNIAVNCLKPRGAVDTEGLRYLHGMADRKTWETPRMMVLASIFLAGLKGAEITGLIATDEEICTTYGLLTG